MNKSDIFTVLQAALIAGLSLLFPLGAVQATKSPSLAPALLNEPEQQSLQNPVPYVFTANQKSYQITPLFSFTLSGLVVGSKSYADWQGQDLGGLLPTDLCLIWGENAQNFRPVSWESTFFQDSLRCTFVNHGQKPFSLAEFTNLHTIAASEEVKRALQSVKPGDQITLTGKLVNVQITDLTTGLPLMYLQTSTSRLDKGDGACEIVWVESISIEKKGSPITQLTSAALPAF